MFSFFFLVMLNVVNNEAVILQDIGPTKSKASPKLAVGLADVLVQSSDMVSVSVEPFVGGTMLQDSSNGT